MSVCADFKSATPEDRWEECIQLQIALDRLKQKEGEPLMGEDVIRLLGEPETPFSKVLHYTIWAKHNTAAGISFWLDRGRVVRITRGAGQTLPMESANQNFNDT